MSCEATHLFRIYAALAVPEIWRYDGQNVYLYELGDGCTTRSPKAACFPASVER